MNIYKKTEEPDREEPSWILAQIYPTFANWVIEIANTAKPLARLACVNRQLCKANKDLWEYYLNLQNKEQSNGQSIQKLPILVSLYNYCKHRKDKLLGEKDVELFENFIQQFDDFINFASTKSVETFYYPLSLLSSRNCHFSASYFFTLPRDGLLAINKNYIETVYIASKYCENLFLNIQFIENMNDENLLAYLLKFIIKMSSFRCFDYFIREFAKNVCECFVVENKFYQVNTSIKDRAFKIIVFLLSYRLIPDELVENYKIIEKCSEYALIDLKNLEYSLFILALAILKKPMSFIKNNNQITEINDSNPKFLNFAVLKNILSNLKKNKDLSMEIELLICRLYYNLLRMNYINLDEVNLDLLMWRNVNKIQNEYQNILSRLYNLKFSNIFNAGNVFLIEISSMELFAKLKAKHVANGYGFLYSWHFNFFRKYINFIPVKLIFQSAFNILGLILTNETKICPSFEQKYLKNNAWQNKKAIINEHIKIVGNDIIDFVELPLRNKVELCYLLRLAHNMNYGNNGWHSDTIVPHWISILFDLLRNESFFEILQKDINFGFIVLELTGTQIPKVKLNFEEIYFLLDIVKKIKDANIQINKELYPLFSRFLGGLYQISKKLDFTVFGNKENQEKSAFNIQESYIKDLMYSSTMDFIRNPSGNLMGHFTIISSFFDTKISFRKEDFPVLMHFIEDSIKIILSLDCEDSLYRRDMLSMFKVYGIIVYFFEEDKVSFQSKYPSNCKILELSDETINKFKISRSDLIDLKTQWLSREFFSSVVSILVNHLRNEKFLETIQEKESMIPEDIFEIFELIGTSVSMSILDFDDSYFLLEIINKIKEKEAQIDQKWLLTYYTFMTNLCTATRNLVFSINNDKNKSKDSFLCNQAMSLQKAMLCTADYVYSFIIQFFKNQNYLSSNLLEDYKITLLFPTDFKKDDYQDLMIFIEHSIIKILSPDFENFLYKDKMMHLFSVLVLTIYLNEEDKITFQKIYPNSYKELKLDFVENK